MSPGPDSPLTAIELAVRAERVDADAWFDQWAAAPVAVQQALGLEALHRGDLRMVRSHVPFSHFNMVLTLGCPASADDAAFAAIENFYAGPNDTPHWVLVNDHSRPTDLSDGLRRRGYADAGSWDRVLLQGQRAQAWAAHAHGCEPVTAENAGAWSRFLLDCYGMPAIIGTWLQALVGRPGWIHVLRRQGGQSNAPVAMVRSLYHDREGWAWLGIDAPVPGVMAPCFADDQAVTATLLVEAARQGAHAFVSDIEVPSPSRDTEAYQRWGALGFQAVYRRNLFVRAPRVAAPSASAG